MMRRTILASALIAPTLFATAAAAQPAPPPGPGAGPMGPPAAEMQARPEAMRKQHVEDLKIVLRLRPDQEAALAAFVASPEPARITRKLPEPDQLTTPQRLDDMAKMEAEMAARHRQARDALAKFYAALSPDQQKVFDALQRLKDPGSGGPHMAMMGGPPPGMGGPGMMFMRRHGPGPGPGPHDDE